MADNARPLICGGLAGHLSLRPVTGKQLSGISSIFALQNCRIPGCEGDDRSPARGSLNRFSRPIFGRRMNVKRIRLQAHERLSGQHTRAAIFLSPINAAFYPFPCRQTRDQKWDKENIHMCAAEMKMPGMASELITDLRGTLEWRRPRAT